MQTVLQNKKECYITSGQCDLEDHHIFFGTANRKKSEQYGLKVWLSRKYHRESPEAVHNNRDLDLHLKITGQKYFESHYGSREDFIKEFGRSYL